MTTDAAGHGRHTQRDLRLASGAVLAEATTAYRTLGRMNAAGDNAVLVLHGYTTGPAMLDAGANVAEGSWSELVGPGRPIDSERWFVICPNMLGSSYGSTGPGSLNPATGRRYGADFPRIELSDIVAAQKSLVDSLGVRRLAAVVGPSYGGYQTLQWGVSHGDMIDRLVCAVSAPWNPPGALQSAPLLEQLSRCSEWRGGHPEPEAMVGWLTAQRVVTLERYGIQAELAQRFPEASARQGEVQRLARQWAEGFDAGSLVVLAQAAETFDLRARLAALRAPLLMVLSRTDTTFAPALASAFGPLLDAAGVPWSYLELDSDKGHLASGADAHLWADVLRRFMATEPAAWVSWGRHVPVPDAAVMAQLAQSLPGMPPQDLPRFARSLAGSEPHAPGAESCPRDGVPRGSLRALQCPPGAIYPGVAHDCTVYVPQQLDPAHAASLIVFMDGARYLGPEVQVPAVLDSLIAEGAMPPTVAVFVNPGANGPGLPIYGGSDHRSIEYDSPGDAFARFLLEELLPFATAGLHIHSDPAQRAICGLSSGGHCAFNAAFERPDAFGKVISHCGSFVNIRGGHLLASAVRRNERKPIKVFLQTGENDLDIIFGHWANANRDLAAALAYRGYAHQLVVGRGGHSLAHGGAIFPDTLRWLWRESTP